MQLKEYEPCWPMRFVSELKPITSKCLSKGMETAICFQAEHVVLKVYVPTTWFNIKHFRFNQIHGG